MSDQLGGLRPGELATWASAVGTGASSTRPATAAIQLDERRQAAWLMAWREGRGNRARVKAEEPHPHSLEPLGPLFHCRRGAATDPGGLESRTR